MGKQLRKRLGVSIAEGMVAIFLIALVMASAYPLILSTTRKLHQARDHSAAITICLAQIERARDIPYEQLGSALGKDDKVRVNEMSASDPQGRFRRTMTVAVNNPDQGLTTVTVTVEIMNRSTRAFSGEKEATSYMFTEYLKPVN